MLAYPVQALSAFAAGLGTSLSPCVYPMIPITVGFLGTGGIQESDRRKRVIGFAVGQVLTFTALGILAVTLGEILGFSSEVPWVQVTTGILLLAFAAFSFFDRLPKFFYRLSSSQGPSRKVNGMAGAFLLGASSAAVASPCTSPVIGGVLAAVSQIDERWRGLSLMFFFATGLSFLFVLIGLGLARLSRLPRAGAWMMLVQKFSSGLLALGGVYYLSKGLTGASFFSWF